MKHVVVFGASTSKGSINKQLAFYASSLLEGDLKLTKLSLDEYEVPMYTEDVQREKGIPEVIEELGLVFDSADGFLVSLAEHNGSYPAAFKNIFDWLSIRKANLWNEKPMFLMSSSPGKRGGKTVLNAALDRFPHMGAIITGSLSVPLFQINFRNRALQDSELLNHLTIEIKKFQKEL